MSDTVSVEQALVQALGLNKDAITPGSVRIDFESGAPRLRFEANYIVPPKLMAVAFQAASPPDPEPDPAPASPPFPEAAGEEDPETTGEGEEEKVHVITDAKEPASEA